MSFSAYVNATLLFISAKRSTDCTQMLPSIPSLLFSYAALPERTVNVRFWSTYCNGEIHSSEKRTLQVAPSSKDLLPVSMHSGISRFYKAARAVALNVADFKKEATGANTLEDFGNEGGQELVQAFLGTIRARSLLDALAQHARPIPNNIQRVLVASGSIASATDEAYAKATTKLDLNLNDSDFRKIAAIVVISEEIARSASPAARRLFERELETAVIAASNQAVMDVLATSNISTEGDPQVDLENALAAAGSSENYVAAMAPSDVRVLALRYPDSGLHVHRGGELVPGIRIVGVADSPLTVIPASRYSLRDFGMSLSHAAHASLEMDTDPDGDSETPTPTQMVSLWQTNSIGLRAERRFRIFGDSPAVQIGEVSG